MAVPVGDIAAAWSNDDVVLGKLLVLLTLFALGCSSLLGADFDPDDTAGTKVSITLAEHPFEAPHDGPQLPPVSLTGSGKVTWSGGKSSCDSSCTIQPESETIELVAEPAAGSLFGGWRTDPPSACDGSLAPVCTLGLHANVSVRAYMVKDGANVWARLGGTSADSVATTLALATSADGSSFQFGDYSGTLENVPVPDAIDAADVVVAKMSRDGEAIAVTAISTPLRDHAADAAATTFGVVVAGEVGEAPNDAEVNLEPVHEMIQSDGAFVIGFDANGALLEPRWSWIAEGDGLTTISNIAVRDDDTTLVLGTFADSLVASTVTITSKVGPEFFLAAIDANGNEKWVTSLGDLRLGGGVGLQVQPDDTFVIASGAGDSPELNALGGDCNPAANALFLARFDPSGQCLKVLSLSPNISTVEALRVDPEGNIVFASRFSGEFEIEGQSLSTRDPSALVVARLGPNLTWVDGISFMTPISGSAKFGGLGTSPTGVAFSVSGEGGLLINSTPFDLTAARTFQLGKLDSNGNLEWWRTLGDSPHVRIVDLEWEPIVEAWLVGGNIEAHLSRPFDFENVTDSATFLQGTDSYVARFAD